MAIKADYIYPMRNYIVLLFILIVSASSAQTFSVFKGDTINRTDAKGKKQGVWKRYYPTDTLFLETVFKDGIHIGTMKTWHPNGKLQSVLKYKGNTDIANATVYSDTG